MAKKIESEDLQAAESQRAGVDQRSANQPPKFRRLENGDVEVHMNGLLIGTIPEAVWVETVAGVSAGGNSPDRTPALLDFHRSVGRVQFTSFE